MELVKDACILTLLGKWNKRRFTHNWVGTEIFDIDDVQVEFSIIDFDAHPRLSNGSIKIGFDGDQLHIIAINADKKSLQEIDEIGKKIIEKTNDTDVKLFGYNIHFIEKDPDSINFEMIKCIDNEGIITEGFTTESSSYRRRLVKTDDYVLYLINSLDISKKTFKVHMNYEYRPTDRDEIFKVLDGKSFLKHFDESIKYLNDFYGITLDEEEE